MSVTVSRTYVYEFHFYPLVTCTAPFKTLLSYCIVTALLPQGQQGETRGNGKKNDEMVQASPGEPVPCYPVPLGRGKCLRRPPLPLVAFPNFCSWALGFVRAVRGQESGARPSVRRRNLYLGKGKSQESNRTCVCLRLCCKESKG